MGWVLGYVLAGVVGFLIGRIRPRVSHPFLTPIGHSLFALAAFAVLQSHVLAHKAKSENPSTELAYVQQWLPSYRIQAADTDDPQYPYYEVREGLRLRGYVFSSQYFSPRVYGYGGPMTLMAFVQPDGTLVDFRITRSYETGRYLRGISGWMEYLKGKTLYGTTTLDQVHTVSGATMSTRAILRLLSYSGRSFSSTVLGQGDTGSASGRFQASVVDWPLMYSITAVVLALVAVYDGRLGSRIAVLGYTVVIGGFQLNRQYSTEHVFRLLSGQNLLGGSLAGLWLLLAVPVIVLLFGNIYCGYLCPFGAIQELVGFIVPKRFKARLSQETIRPARFVKYLLLFIFVVTFFATGSTYLLNTDPLALFFNMRFWTEGFAASPGLITAIVVLLASLVTTRFWCRYLCPAGAFLSLWNHAAFLRRWLPARKLGRCEFGLNGNDQLDCIYCDRCRYETQLLPKRDEIITRTPSPATTIIFLVALLYLIVFMLVPIIEQAPHS